MVEIGPFILKWGYLGLFGAAMIYSEPIVIGISFLCRSLGFNFFYVFLLSFLGTLFGSILCFLIGRLFKKQLCRFERFALAFGKVNILIERYSLWFIICFRFIYGVKLVSPLVLGISEISINNFLLSNVLGAMIWSGLMTCIGMCLSCYFKELTFKIFIYIYMSTVAIPFFIVFFQKFFKSK